MKGGHQNGFTLVELLVSLALLSMVMIMIYGTLNFSASALAKNVKSTNATEEISQTQELLRRVIENSIPQRNTFSGSKEQIKFQSNINGYGGIKGEYEISIFKEVSKLVMDWKKVGEDTLSDIGQRQGKLILADDIEGVEMSYAGRDFATSDTWQTIWSDGEIQPEFVKITLQTNEFWPEMVIGLKVSHTIRCWYDPVSRGCQYR